MAIDTKKWFFVLDSELMDQDGEPTGVYNIRARFTDHPVLNVEKSRIARHNVYDLAPCLHMQVLHNSDGDPLPTRVEAKVENSTSHVMRFDRGEDTRVASQRPGPAGNPVLHYDGSPGMGKEEFEAAIRDIKRCSDAWQHYQTFRESPITPMEKKAMEIIAHGPQTQAGVIMVEIDGKLVARSLDGDDDADQDEDEAPARPAQRGRKRKTAA